MSLSHPSGPPPKKRVTVPEPIAHTSHTYAVLDISCEAYQEIRRRIVEAGPEFEYKIEGDEQGEVIDMNGLALAELEPTRTERAAELREGRNDCCEHRPPCEPDPTEVKILPQYNDPIAGAETAITILCSCSAPDVSLEPATALVTVGVATQDKGEPTIEFLCGNCGAGALIIRHTTLADETFRKAGREPEKKDLG